MLILSDNNVSTIARRIDKNMDDKKISTIFKKYTSIIENETLGTKAIIYGASSFGLLYAVYAIRPFTKFRRPSDIPNHFLRDYIPFRGTVVYIEAGNNNTLLMVNHRSMIPLPRWGNHRYLPVKIPGINVTSNGISWLQSIVVGENISLVPVSKQKEFVECIATIPQRDEKHLNIANELLKLGFSTVADKKSEPISNDYVRLYFKSLLKAQKYGERNRNGYWQFNRSPTFIWRLQMYLRNKIGLTVPMLKTT